MVITFDDYFIRAINKRYGVFETKGSFMDFYVNDIRKARWSDIEYLIEKHSRRSLTLEMVECYEQVHQKQCPLEANSSCRNSVDAYKENTLRRAQAIKDTLASDKIIAEMASWR